MRTFARFIVSLAMIGGILAAMAIAGAIENGAIN